jgi:hypothetical protein
MAKVTVTFDFDDDDINMDDIAEHVRQVLYSSYDVYNLLDEAEISVDDDSRNVVDSMIDNGILIPNWFEKSDIESMIERKISDDDWTEYLELCYRAKLAYARPPQKLCLNLLMNIFKVDGE